MSMPPLHRVAGLATLFALFLINPALLAPLHAEGGDQYAYARLTEDNKISADPDTTGSLPAASDGKDRSLSGFYDYVEAGSISLRESTPTQCLPGDLKSVLADVAARFGPVSIESTHRSKGHNRRAGGARRSLHLSCRAVDFRVRTRTRGLMAYLASRPEVGGVKVYRNGIIHIDNGERRRW